MGDKDRAAQAVRFVAFIAVAPIVTLEIAI
jgi:hypothetical protein